MLFSKRLKFIFEIIIILSLGSCSDMSTGDSSVKDIGSQERPVGLILSDIEYGQTETITLNLPLDATGSVDFSVTGKGNYTGVEVVDGKASIEVSDLELGIYPVLATYSGDSTHPSIVKEGDFAVINLLLLM